MATYFTKVRELIGSFQKFEIKQIPRSQIANADSLVKLAAVYEMKLGRWVPVEILEQPNILEEEVKAINNLEVCEGPIWYDPII